MESTRIILLLRFNDSNVPATSANNRHSTQLGLHALRQTATPHLSGRNSYYDLA